MQKPSESEQEYFARQEAERLRKHREKVAQGTGEKERERLKELHWMHCPKCGMEMEEIDYLTVKVDACFACGGMFFDKGEVEKIIERDEPGFGKKLYSVLFPKSK